MVAHAIQLTNGGLGSNLSTRFRPSLLALDDQDFVNRFLSELEREDGLSRLQKKIATARNSQNMLRLYQPVHQIFHMALIDVSCVRQGEPRVDPQRIAGSGLVVRRLDEKGRRLGWMKREGRIVGWRPIPATAKADKQGDPDYDPSPELRRQRALGSNVTLLSQLEPADAVSAGYAEDFVNLFPTTPRIVERHGRTFLYGVVPLTSSESSEEDETAAPFDRTDILERMPGLLRAGDIRRVGLPPISSTMDNSSLGYDGAILMVSNLRYLGNEVGLFTEAKPAKALYKLLDKVAMPRNSAAKTLARFLHKAYRVLIERDPEAGHSIAMPERWPAIAAGGKGASEKNIVAGIEACMLARWADLAPARSRFEGTDARYVVRAFVRVTDSPRCPPRTVWSEESEPFEIVPWYESSGKPPVQIQLPEINNDTLKNLKPNVAFKVPQSLQQVMDKINMEDLLDGKSNKSNTRWGMICGFSIPIITLCAFIFLQIFLSLLNIVFFWLPFIKICIPFPKKA